MKTHFASMLFVSFGLLVGCSNQTTAFQAQVTAVAAGLITADNLFLANVISKAELKRIWTDGSVADHGFQVALQGIELGLPPDVNAVNEITTALAELAKDIQSTSPGKAQALRMKLKATAQKQTLSPTDIVTLVNLAIQLFPEVTNEINLLNKNVPTVNDCKVALALFEQKLAKLKADGGF